MFDLLLVGTDQNQTSQNLAVRSQATWSVMLFSARTIGLFGSAIAPASLDELVEVGIHLATHAAEALAVRELK